MSYCKVKKDDPDATLTQVGCLSRDSPEVIQTSGIMFHDRREEMEIR